MGRRVQPDRDAVALDGVPVVVRDDLVYYLLNKPTGFVAPRRSGGALTVVELVPESPHVFPVGRLDYDTEGLLLLTNDGDLTHLLTHPRFGVVKTYLAEVEGDPAPAAVRALREGVELDDGITAAVRRVNVVQRRGETSGAVELGIPRRPEPPGATHVEAGSAIPWSGWCAWRIGPLRDGSLKPGECAHAHAGRGARRCTRPRGHRHISN